VFADPQVRHLKMALPIEHKRLGPQLMVASAINISGIPKDIRTPTPEAGADTDDVMREVGYSDAEIGQMRATGAIK
jgi:formyl-CoA transferase